MNENIDLGLMHVLFCLIFDFENTGPIKFTSPFESCWQHFMLFYNSEFSNLKFYIFSYSNCPCMVALTIDRLVAIVRPFRHRTIFTTKFCIALCVSMWLPQIVFYCWFAISMTTNSSAYSVSTLV